MRLVRFGPPNREKPGIINADGKIRDLSNVVPDIAGDALSPHGLNKIRKTDLKKLPVVRSGTRLGPCVGNTRHFIAIGLNYIDHAKETNAEIPKEPIIFSKAPTCISGPYDDVIPRRSSALTTLLTCRSASRSCSTPPMWRLQRRSWRPWPASCSRGS